MSGPIIRKYGFPNFDQIFGKRELQHGVEDTPAEGENKAETSEKAKADAPASGEAKDAPSKS